MNLKTLRGFPIISLQVCNKGLSAQFYKANSFFDESATSLSAPEQLRSRNDKRRLKHNPLRWFLFTSLLLTTHNLQLTGYQQVSCVMHLHSTFSDNGKLTLEQIVKKATEKNIQVVIPTDHDIMKWEYGIFPFRKLILKVIEKKSVLQAGVEKYLAEIQRLEKIFPETIVIPGVESTAFYYWSGSLLKKNLTMHNWHKHLLVVGLNTPEKYYYLPVAGNHLAEKFNFLLLWPVIVLICSLIFFRRKNLLKIFIAFVSLLFLINNFPFRSYKYSIYSEVTEEPYQDLINYVISNNGLVYWAHPEAPNYKLPAKAGKIFIQTLPYPESILNTKNYTGFGYFWEGDEIVGKGGDGGGYWDKVLIEYCGGGKSERKFPVWSIGELDYIADGINNNYIDLVKNILLVEEFSENAVIDALRSGRYYTISKSNTGGYELRLNKFLLKNNGYIATLGETLICSSSPNTPPTPPSPPEVIFSISTSDGVPHPVRISVIRDGEVIKVFEQMTPYEIKFQEKLPKGTKSYYRIEATAPGVKLVTNPIFFIM